MISLVIHHDQCGFGIFSLQKTKLIKCKLQGMRLRQPKYCQCIWKGLKLHYKSSDDLTFDRLFRWRISVKSSCILAGVREQLAPDLWNFRRYYFILIESPSHWNCWNVFDFLKTFLRASFLELLHLVCFDRYLPFQFHKYLFTSTTLTNVRSQGALVAPPSYTF